ncbi:MAG TPA: amidase [Terriglobales bacterium]|nr:amidase [Terriglobales bacterium]
MTPRKTPELQRLNRLLDTFRAKKHERPGPEDASRRNFIQVGALAGAAASLASVTAVPNLHAEGTGAVPTSLNERTIADFRALMAEGRLTSVSLVNYYLERINRLDQRGPTVNSIIELNPDAPGIARELDAERRAGRVRGPMHGIPVLLKDNIDTADRMQSAAGSLALVGQPAPRDATVAANLRQAGAVILGKTTLSEWANFRSFFSTSGWSARGGQCNNPYAIDRNPCGSSSGSAAAPSANFTAVSIGTETDGSIICPASMNGVVGIKPTVGLVSRAGVVPISSTQDTIGPHTRTVADAAAVLNVIISRTPDPRDPATSRSPLGKSGEPRPDLSNVDYARNLDRNGLAGAKIGVARMGVADATPDTAVLFEDAVKAIQDAGATTVEVEFPHQDELDSGTAEFTVLLFDFKRDLQRYLADRVGVPIAQGTLADAIAFNIEHAEEEMKFFGQEIFELAETFDITDETKEQPLGISYREALETNRRIGATQGIDQLLRQNGLDAIVAPSDSPPFPTDLILGDHFVFGSSSPAAVAGYPLINVTMGFVFGVPVGITFMGTAFSEPTLIKLASGFESVTRARQVPRFLRTLSFDTKGQQHRAVSKGTTVSKPSRPPVKLKM